MQDDENKKNPGTRFAHEEKVSGKGPDQVKEELNSDHDHVVLCCDQVMMESKTTFNREKIKNKGKFPGFLSFLFCGF
jgi:hypothetical protein